VEAVSQSRVLVPTRQANGNERAAVLDRDDPAARLDEYLRDTATVALHDLRLPNGGGKLTHLVIGPAGITVIDSRNYRSRRAKVGRGGLRVGRRNRSDLVKNVLHQVDSVQSALAGTPYADVPVEAALAWREVEGLPILHTFNAPRVVICGTRKIAREAARPGPLSSRKVDALASYLAGELAD
jgi:nuclease-like protein